MNYKIELQKLNLGNSKLNFEINSSFFEQRNYSDIKNADIIIIADISVKTSSISFDFQIKGTIETECDICLDNFNLEIDTKKDLFVRFSDRNEGMEEEFEDDNIITVSKTEEFIDLEEHFFDFIILSLPIKKVHPLDKEGNRTCNPEFLKKIKELENNTIKTNDPRWDKLKQLLN